MRHARYTPVIFRNPDPYPEDVLGAAKAHAISEFPKESCGVVLSVEGQLEYAPCINTRANPEDEFEIAPEETVQLLQRGTILALIHSHPEGPNYPSMADQQKQIANDMVWGIIPVIGSTGSEGEVVPIATDIVWWGDGLPTQPLLQRKFIWGVFHCYAIFRDWWWMERGVRIPNFPCPGDFIESGVNIFMDNVTKAGLRNLGKIDIRDLQVGDMLVGHLKGGFPNHCGVYTGGDDFLHHPAGGVSGTAELFRWWPHVDTVFRYEQPADIAPLRKSRRRVRPNA